MGLPLSNDGKPVPAQLGVGGGFIPKGAKNVEVGQGFPEIPDPAEVNERLPEGRARPLAAGDAVDRQERPVLAGSADPHRAAYVEQGVLGQTVPNYSVFNPAYAEVATRSMSGARPRPTSSATA